MKPTDMLSNFSPFNHVIFVGFNNFIFFKNVIKVIDCFCICCVSISHQKSDAWDVNLGAQMSIAHGAVNVICLFS